MKWLFGLIRKCFNLGVATWIKISPHSKAHTFTVEHSAEVAVGLIVSSVGKKKVRVRLQPSLSFEFARRVPFSVLQKALRREARVLVARYFGLSAGSLNATKNDSPDVHFIEVTSKSRGIDFTELTSKKDAKASVSKKISWFGRVTISLLVGDPLPSCRKFASRVIVTVFPPVARDSEVCDIVPYDVLSKRVDEEAKALVSRTFGVPAGNLRIDTRYRSDPGRELEIGSRQRCF